MSVIKEMLNINAYSDQITAFIMSDLKANPLGKDERLNLIGYSGGGQVAFNVADKLSGQRVVDELITLGSPIGKVRKKNVRVMTHFIGHNDLLYQLIRQTNRTEDSQFYKNVFHSGEGSYLNTDRVIDDVADIFR